MGILKNAVRGSFTGSGITLKQAAAIPYASMGWRLNDGQQSIIVLATDNAQGQLWTSRSHVVLLTQDGRIKRTVGLPHDIGALGSRTGAAMMPPGDALRGAYAEQHIADFPDIGRFGVTLNCSAAMHGAQGILLLGKRISTIRIEERCNASLMDWTFTNIYWVDRDSGFVWKSRQHIHPTGDVLETEIFRPPG